MAQLLGLSNFDIQIRQHMAGYEFEVSFYLTATGTYYMASEVRQSPQQCWNAAIGFLNAALEAANEERRIAERVQVWAGAERTT